MSLKSTVDTLDGVPEALHSFYTAKDGKFSLAVEGMVPKARLDEFREGNIATRRLLDEMTAKYEGVDPDQFRELTAQAAKVRDRKLIEAGKVDELVAERVAAMKADADKTIQALTKGEATVRAQLESLVLDGGLRDAAMKAGVKPTAVDDVLLRGRQMFRLQDGKAVAMDGDKVLFGKDGEPMPIHEWVDGLASRAPHLFEAAAGGGANVAKPGASGAKTMTRAQFDAMDGAARYAAVKSGTAFTD